MTDHVDLLMLAGIDHNVFYSSGEDVKVVGERDRTIARVFRRGGKMVYRAGSAVDWYGDEPDRPLT
jgi:hypothetical protein